MKKIIYKLLSLALVLGLGVGFLSVAPAWAEDEGGESEDVVGTSISLSPVSKVLELSSKSSYTDSLQVKNDGKDDLDVEVYAAPYSYVYSEDEDAYKLGFSNEIGFMSLGEMGGGYLCNTYYNTCSEGMRRQAEEAIQAILKNCYKSAKEVLTENKDILIALAKEIFVQKEVSGERLEKLYEKLSKSKS